jgi:hypothetical protein
MKSRRRKSKKPNAWRFFITDSSDPVRKARIKNIKEKLG